MIQKDCAFPFLPAAELVELGKAEAFCILDHHHRGVGDVDAHLNYRGGYQYMDFSCANRSMIAFFSLAFILP